jgi:adenylate cyclase
MGYEIERKFLVDDDGWRAEAGPGARMCQGYLASGRRGSVRVRTSGERAWLNIKGVTLGAKRREFEYPVPLDDALTILDKLCDGPLIDKTRYLVEHAGFTWEVDVFEGANSGLVVAEIELPSEETPFERPAWAGREVTAVKRYYNSCLVDHPYSDWSAAERGGHAEADGNNDR